MQAAGFDLSARVGFVLRVDDEGGDLVIGRERSHFVLHIAVLHIAKRWHAPGRARSHYLFRLTDLLLFTADVGIFGATAGLTVTPI
jgi:hypothetical protein